MAKVKKKFLTVDRILKKKTYAYSEIILKISFWKKKDLYLKKRFKNFRRVRSVYVCIGV